MEYLHHYFKVTDKFAMIIKPVFKIMQFSDVNMKYNQKED